MSGEQQNRQTIRFGVFELDLAAGLLRKRGRRVKLEAQPFQVLTILLRRPGELVTRDELQKELWPEDTFVEFDHSLNTAVNKIRQALGDSARAPSYVETAPRQGYRFIAAVEIIEAVTNAGLGNTGKQRPPSRRWIAALVLAVAGFAAVAGWYFAPNNDLPVEPLVTRPLTSFPKSEWNASFSPDGNQVVFEWDGNIHIISADGENLRQLTTDGGADPAWSPDGKWIAYRRSLDIERDEIVLLSPVDGRTKSVAQVSTIHWISKPALTWSPDARWLVISHKAPGSESHGLFLWSVETGESRRLTDPPIALMDDSRPAFSPDGRTLAFARVMMRDRGIYTLALTEELQPAGEPRRIVPALEEGMSRPLWSEDGKELVYSNENALWRIPVSGDSEPRRIAFTENTFCTALHHGQGRLLCSKILMGGASIWEAPLGSNGEPGDAPRKLIESNARDFLPRISPDGGQIIFSSSRSGFSEIWKCDRDGSNPVKLTSLGPPETEYSSWSPDGRYIVFHAGETVYVMNADGSSRRKLTEGSTPWWSRDGDWIYFKREAESGSQILKIHAAGGPATQVTQNGGICPLESPDGTHLYYLKSWMTDDVKPLWRIHVEGGEEERVLDNVRNAAAFDVIEDGVYYIPGLEPGVEPGVYFHDFGTGESKKVVPLPDLGYVDYGLDVSPDGKSLLYCRFDWNLDLVIAEDFR